MNTHFVKATGISLGIAIASLFPASAASALDYGSANLGGSTYMTWGVEWSGQGDIGYLCVTQDALEAMSRTAIIHRYEVNAQDGFADIYLLNAVFIAPGEDGTYSAHPDEPPPTSELWNRATLDESGEWFAEEMPVVPMGAACVDGGVAGAIQYLENTHGITIQEQSERYAVLNTQEEGSRVNLRDNPSSQGSASRYGLDGNRVLILNQVRGEDGFTWYQVRFPVSEAVGWVRGDFVEIE